MANKLVKLITATTFVIHKGEQKRPVETRPEGQRAGVGFLGGEQRAPAPLHQLGVLWSAVSSADLGKFGFLEHFGTSENTSERLASF